MGGRDALDGMARALARRGVTSFLPTSVTASFERLTAFADSVRAWMPTAPADGAEPLGFNMEGPFLAESRKGAHPAALLRHPDELDEATLETFLEGLRIMTVAPELRGALELIEHLAGAWRARLAGPLGGRRRAGAGRLRRRRRDDDAPLQRHGRPHASRPGAGAGGSPR